MGYRPGPDGALRKASMMEANSDSKEEVITAGDI
jgi:hypothetical protein